MKIYRNKRITFSWIRIITSLVIILIFCQVLLWKIIQNSTTTQQNPTKTTGVVFYEPFKADSETVETSGDKWYEIKSTEGRIFLFSAYLDTRHVPIIRIIGVLTQKHQTTLFCHLVTTKSVNSRGVFTVNAKLSKHKEAWSMKYSSYFIDCYVPNGFHKETDELLVSVSESNIFSIDNTMLHVHQIKPIEEQKKSSFAVCVKPMHYEYDRAVWLVEFVELHLILGVQHFYFYNHSVGPNVQQVLQHYHSIGIVTILQWQIDIKSQEEIRTEAMFASINDCLHRTMHLYKFTIFIDFDEYIIPKKDRNYLEMMRRYEQLTNICAYVFKNTFFYLYHENDTNFLNEQSQHRLTSNFPYLITLFKTKRTEKLNNYGQRSKYIVRPENCILLGNHIAWTTMPGKRNQFVRPDIGLSHHYRICEGGGYDCVKSTTVFDNSTWRYAQNLVSNVEQICEKVYPNDKQCPESPPLGSAW